MKYYALIEEETVMQVCVFDDVTVPDGWVDVTKEKPMPAPNWTYTGGVFSENYKPPQIVDTEETTNEKLDRLIEALETAGVIVSENKE